MKPRDNLPARQPRPRGGRRSRDKGNRAERAIVAFLQDNGFAAERVPLSGSAGGKYVGDVTIPLLGRDMCAEVKVRAHGFGQLYAWLDGREILIVRQDRREPLVILTLRLAAEVAGYAERNSRKICFNQPKNTPQQWRGKGITPMQGITKTEPTYNLVENSDQSEFLLACLRAASLRAKLILYRSEICT